MKSSIFFLAVITFSCSQPGYKIPHILIETRQGDIEVELYPDKAPVTVAAFLSYIDSGYYNNSSLKRVLKADELPNPNNTGIIQGGIRQTKPCLKATLPGIKHETTAQSRLTHQSGTVSLARTSPGTANCKFFICNGDKNR